MDLNEIKNRAKDLLADLTEPRPERDDRRDHDRAEDADRRLGDRAEETDRRTDDRVEDPAARTDRLDRPVAPTDASAEAPLAGAEAHATSEPVVHPTEGGHVGHDRSDFPEPARWDPRAPIADGVDEQPGPSDTSWRERDHDADAGPVGDATADGRDDLRTDTTAADVRRADTVPADAARADTVPVGVGRADATPSAAESDLDQPGEQGRHQYREPEPGFREAESREAGYSESDRREPEYREPESREAEYREPEYREAESREPEYRESESREPGYRDGESRDAGYGESDRRETAGGLTHGSGDTVAAAAPVAGAAAAEPARPSAGARTIHEPTATDASTAAGSGTPDRLVTAERAQSYSSRWDEVKGEFVDEPRQAVAKADALVGELLDELGQLFDRQRRGIEHDFENDDVSTEELRVALRRYRSFFDRLLSV